MKHSTIYIDWNLYSILKKPELDIHKILNDFLITNKDFIRLVYSPAHLDDLKKSSSKKTRDQDLKYLSKLTDNNCIVNYWGSKDVLLDKRDALEFFKTNQRDNSHLIFRITNFLIKMMAHRYSKIRDKIMREHFKTDPSEICNFSLKQLDELIRLSGFSSSLDNFLTMGLKLRTSKSDILSYIDTYSAAYTSLDLINYFPDSMKEKGNFNNLKNDAIHSAYGSLCDAFITNDNKCFHKSKLLFNYYKCKSKLIKTCKVKDMKSFENELNSIIK